MSGRLDFSWSNERRLSWQKQVRHAHPSTRLWFSFLSDFCALGVWWQILTRTKARHLFKLLLLFPHPHTHYCSFIFVLPCTSLGILNNAQSLLGTDTVNSLTGLVSSHTLSVFRDQDRWKKLKTTTQTVPVNNDLFKTSASWAGIRSQLDAEGTLNENEVSEYKGS